MVCIVMAARRPHVRIIYKLQCRASGYAKTAAQIRPKSVHKQTDRPIYGFCFCVVEEHLRRASAQACGCRHYTNLNSRCSGPLARLSGDLTKHVGKTRCVCRKRVRLGGQTHEGAPMYLQSTPI